MNDDFHGMTKKERKALRRAEKVERQQMKISVNLWDRFKWWGVLVGVVALFAYWIYQGIIPTPPGEADKPLDRIAENDWVRGNRNADVVVIEYSDLQCPACRVYYPLLKELEASYGDRVAFVYRHFPLKQIHLHAEMAAYAAEAAGQQGKFWEMHDQLFEHQDEWAESGKARAFITQYAQDIGLSVDQFKKDWGSKLVKGLVNADYMSGLTYNVNATPTFYINGEKVDNPQGLDAFASILDSKLGSPSSSVLPPTQ